MSLIVKVHNEDNGEVRRFRLDESVCTNFEYLKQKIATLFNIDLSANLHIRWKDDKEDFITISSDEELVDAFGSRTDDILRLHIRTGKTAKDEEERRHVGVVCDVCEQGIVGYRFKCICCLDYDLCQNCFLKKEHSEHEMLVIRSPDWFPHRLLTKVAEQLQVLQEFAGFPEPQEPGTSSTEGAAETGNTEGEEWSGWPFPFMMPVFGRRGPFFGAGRCFPGTGARGGFGHCPFGRGGMRGFHCRRGGSGRRFWTEGTEKTTEQKKEQHTDMQTDLPADASHTSSDSNDSDMVILEQEEASHPQVVPMTPLVQAERIPSGPEEPQSFVSEEPLPDNIQQSLNSMKSMGFTDDGGWLTMLLKDKNGDINQVLEIIKFSRQQSD